MPEKVYILSAPVGSGKTTALHQWSKNRTDAFGILTPIIHGKRMFMDIETQEVFSMLARDGEESLDVGRYRFSKASFEKAIAILRNAKEKSGWLIIDEIGPLELKDEGFSQVFREIVTSTNSQKIIVVVRDRLLHQVIDHFGLTCFELMARFEPQSL